MFPTDLVNIGAVNEGASRVPRNGESRVPWLTNGTVAWEIPEGRLARLFFNKTYYAPDGWEVIHNLKPDGPPWAKGVCGEMRREVTNAS